MSNDLQPINQYDGIRRVWDKTTNRWWFAVVDVVHVLSEATDPSRYWADMKRRDNSGQLLAVCEKFPMKSLKNNRTYKTECANQRGILRIIQSIPSPKFEGNEKAAKKGGENAGIARKSFEKASGRPVISDQSYLETRKRIDAGEEPDDDLPF
jgi:hypothetical protein